MNGTATAAVHWSARRWFYVISAVFSAQAGLVLYLGQHETTPVVRPAFRTAIHLVADQWSVDRLAGLSGMTDPTLLALPNEKGFSGAAWMKSAPLEYRPEPWIDPPHWLALTQTNLGAGLASIAGASDVIPATIADKPPPPMVRYEPALANIPLPAVSRLRVEGELAARPLLRPLELNPREHTELLSNTVVQVTVDADGFVLTSQPLAGCGLKEADADALRLASAARFRPLPRTARDGTGRGPLVWGKLIFQWHTLPVRATNAVPIPP